MVKMSEVKRAREIRIFHIKQMMAVVKKEKEQDSYARGYLAALDWVLREIEGVE